MRGCPIRALTAGLLYRLITQVCVPKSDAKRRTRILCRGPKGEQEQCRGHVALQALRPTLPILIGASLMLTLSMGLRQSFGIFMQPLTHDIGISVSQFTLALAVQNLAWGFLQPVAGAMTVRYGFRPIMMVGSVIYIAGLALMATAHGMIPILIGARRADRHVAGLHGECDCDVGLGARGARDGAQHRDGHGLGGGIARRIGVGAARTDAERRFWLAGGRRRLCDPVALHAAGSLVCRPGRQDSAAAQGRRRHRRRFGRDGRQDRFRQCIVRGDDLRLFRLRHAARLPHHASAVLSR